MVYVDPLLDWGWHLGRSCHMLADTLDELHAMADKIGLKRNYFQDKSIPHYDLTTSRRAAAVAIGAVEITRREVAVMCQCYKRFGRLHGDPGVSKKRSRPG